MTAHVSIENIAKMPARISHVRVQVEGFELNRDDPQEYVLRGGDTAWLDAVSVTGKLVGLKPPHIPILTTSEPVDSQQWQKFHWNLPPVVVTVRYSDPMGRKFEASSGFRPFGAWGGVYNGWGGDAVNYDRKIEEEPKTEVVAPPT